MEPTQSPRLEVSHLSGGRRQESKQVGPAQSEIWMCPLGSESRIPGVGSQGADPRELGGSQIPTLAREQVVPERFLQFLDGERSHKQHTDLLQPTTHTNSKGLQLLVGMGCQIPNGALQGALSELLPLEF